MVGALPQQATCRSAVETSASRLSKEFKQNASLVSFCGASIFEHKFFPARLIRHIDTSDLAWPVRREATTGFGMGCNCDYQDFRRLPWREAQRLLNAELSFVLQIEKARRPEATCRAIDRELFETSVLHNLDLGIASSVVALSAAGCVPFSSCNAGAFGGFHPEQFPCVAFCARPETCVLLLECGTSASIGLADSDRVLVAYAEDIRGMLRFAASLIERRRQFSAVHKSRPRAGRAAGVVTPDFTRAALARSGDRSSGRSLAKDRPEVSSKPNFRSLAELRVPHRRR